MSVINEIKKGTTVYDIQDKNAIQDPSSKSEGQILTYNGTAWVAQNAAPSGVISVTAGDNSVAMGGTASNPTVAAKISTVDGNGLSVKSDGLYAAATDLSDVEERLDTIEGKEAGWDAKQDAIPANTYDVYGAASGVQTNLDAVTAKISDVATSSNKLVSASEMGDAIEAVEAKQLYKTNAQGSFATKAELTGASTFYNADGSVATPTKNDVAYVLADESHDGKSAKYVVSNDTTSGAAPVWGFVITFSNTTFNQQQMDAINSGMSSTDKTKLDGIATGATNVTSSTVSGWGYKKVAYGASTPDITLSAGDLWLQG